MVYFSNPRRFSSARHKAGYDFLPSSSPLRINSRMTERGVGALGAAALFLAALAVAFGQDFDPDSLG
jgi:hypothetical protein